MFVFATVPGRSPPQSLKSRGPGTRADANPGNCSTPTGRHRNTVPTAVAELQWDNIEICRRAGAGRNNKSIVDRGKWCIPKLMASW